jgi:two-component system cell cycle sensor histidine kinase PleC
MSAEHTPLSRALSLASHELRTPVSVVAGYLKMVLQDPGGAIGERQRKWLEEAQRSCSRIAALLDEMSELGKLESRQIHLARRRFDLAGLLAELASRMHEGSDRGVGLEMRGVDRPIEAFGDPDRLGRALGSLLHASLRERGEPGVIVAECTVGGGTTPVAIIAISDAQSVGELAAAAAGGQVFDEWAQGGLGLALPLARRIVEAHGGALWAGKGGGPRSGAAVRIPLGADTVQTTQR